MNLTTLTLTQLFTRQGALNAQHQSAILRRDQHPIISAEWDLWNGLATGLMEDMADVNTEIAGRLADMLAETRVKSLDVPMVCTACRRPVMRIDDQGWGHADPSDIYTCDRPAGGPVKAMVAAGNESVPRSGLPQWPIQAIPNGGA